MEQPNNKFAGAIRGIYGRLGPKYLQDIAEGGPPEINEFMKLLPAGGAVVDIGCAGGRDSKIFSDSGFKVTGLDITEEFLEEGRRSVPQAEFLNMDVTDIQLPAESADAVWANAVLLHVDKEDIPRALQNINHVLKPGGKLHIRVKQGEGTKEVVEKLTGEERRPFIFFQKDEMEQYVTGAGFKIISSEVLPDDMGRADVQWIKIWAQK